MGQRTGLALAAVLLATSALGGVAHRLRIVAAT